MAKRPPISLILLVGAASAAGAAFAAYTVKKRRQKAEPAENSAGEKDAEPGVPTMNCPKCGSEIKKYEFFCPLCGVSLDGA